VRRDEATLIDIANAAQLALDFAAGLTRDEFLRDLKTQSAVIHQLTILGEAVKRLSKDFRAIIPKYPGLSLPVCATNSFMRTMPLTWMKYGGR
jgi:uncharacterized protein with HEPN domain